MNSKIKIKKELEKILVDTEHFLCISHFNGELDWINNLNRSKYLVYNKSKHKLNKTINSIQIKNVGYNIYSYLKFIIENYVRENKLEEIDDINQILKIKLPSSQIVSKKKKSKNLEFDEENLKKFMQKWRTGHTTVEISEEFKKENLDIERSRKKRFKL